MCGPAAVAIATVASTLVGAYATYQQGEVQQDFAQYEARQAEADAKAEQGAAQVEADRIRKRGKAAVEEANAAIAGSGQSLASAGSLAINRDITRDVEEDAYFALLGGRDRAAQLNSQAGLSRMRGKAAKQAGTMGAFATALQGGTNAYTGWRQAGGGKG